MADQPVTNVQSGNSPSFELGFSSLLSDSYVVGFPLAALCIEPDDLPALIERYGTPACLGLGAELQTIAKAFLRSSDLVGWLTDGQLVVVLNGSPVQIAPRIAEQFRRKVEAARFLTSLDGREFAQITLSIGIASTLDANLEPALEEGLPFGEQSVRNLANAAEVGARLLNNAILTLRVAQEAGGNQVRLSQYYPVTWATQEVPAAEVIRPTA